MTEFERKDMPVQKGEKRPGKIDDQKLTEYTGNLLKLYELLGNALRKLARELKYKESKFVKFMEDKWKKSKRP